MQNALAGLQDLSKTALVKKATGLISANNRAKNAAEQLGDKVMDALGSLSATAAGFAIGYAEQRYQNKDGTPMSLGPVKLGLAGAFAFQGIALFFNPGRQLSAVANGCAGAYGSTLGRGTAIAQKQKEAQKTPSVGYEEIVGGENAWTPGEASLLG